MRTGAAYSEVEFNASSTVYRFGDINLKTNRSDVISAIHKYNGSDERLLITTWSAIYVIRVLSGGRPIEQISQSRREDIQLVAGDMDESGYVDGVGEKARFNSLRDVIRVRDGYLVSDYENHCLRYMVPAGNGELNVTSAVGKCEEIGDQDGTTETARFNGPYGLAHRDGVFYVTDSQNRKIKRIVFEADTVETIHESDSYGLWYLVAGATTGEFHVTVRGGVLRVSNGGESMLVGKQNGFKDGQFSGAEFYSPQKTAELSSRYLLVADQWNNRIRVLDRQSQKVTSLCDGKYAVGGGSGSGVGVVVVVMMQLRWCCCCCDAVVVLVLL